jgi:hypothetical protein
MSKILKLVVYYIHLTEVTKKLNPCCTTREMIVRCLYPEKLLDQEKRMFSKALTAAASAAAS